MYVRYHTANKVSNFDGDSVTQLHFITICNVLSYLRHVKRLGICLPRGRSRSIIFIIIKLYFQAHMQTITKAQRTHSIALHSWAI